ncbi:hypothetical protein IEJ02_19445 [Streptomyces sp. 5-10]|nr:hypothetical protein [Streptomyces sp. 5-10]
MIASTPVARWTWGNEDDAGDAVERTVTGVLDAFSVLASHRLAVGNPRVRVSVSESGHPENSLFSGEFEVTESDGSDLVRLVRRGLRSGKPGAVEANIRCPGVWLGADGTEHREERLLTFGASMLLGYYTARLTTYSDAWMPYDLRGRPQEAVHAANYPRLAAALREISELIGDDTDPDDPTWFGKPTETGVDNYFDDDGSASDVWGSFEIPYRNRIFHHNTGFGGDDYARTAKGEVEYAPVTSERGGILGYLWASDAEGAASYEPRDAAEDAGYHAGLRWLERLRRAKESGLAPSQALAEFAREPADTQAGRVDLASRATAPDLATLRELAGREN